VGAARRGPLPPAGLRRCRDSLRTRISRIPTPLVGDAGYNRDFITAQGIHDAFRDAELCAAALHQVFSGGRPFDDAMADYQARRDAQVLPMYELTTELATLEPPPPDLAALLAAMAGNQAAMDGFARVNAGVTSPAEFFAEDNVGRILAAAG
jgi:2-polyprenyl-6-methoxyphenol hydroxylase-like FAD-dependent oxidoreductase